MFHPVTCCWMVDVLQCGGLIMKIQNRVTHSQIRIWNTDRERQTIWVCQVLLNLWGGHFTRTEMLLHTIRSVTMEMNTHTHTSPHAAPWGPARPFFDGMRLWISPALPRQQHVSKPWRLIFIKKVKVMEIIRLFLNRGAPRPPGEIPSPPPRMSSQINPSIRLTTSNLLKRRCWQRMQC